MFAIGRRQQNKYFQLLLEFLTSYSTLDFLNWLLVSTLDYMMNLAEYVL